MERRTPADDAQDGCETILTVAVLGARAPVVTDLGRRKLATRKSCTKPEVWATRPALAASLDVGAAWRRHPLQPDVLRRIALLRKQALAARRFRFGERRWSLTGKPAIGTSREMIAVAPPPAP